MLTHTCEVGTPSRSLSRYPLALAPELSQHRWAMGSGLYTCSAPVAATLCTGHRPKTGDHAHLIYAFRVQSSEQV